MLERGTLYLHLEVCRALIFEGVARQAPRDFVSHTNPIVRGAV